MNRPLINVSKDT